MDLVRWLGLRREGPAVRLAGKILEVGWRQSDDVRYTGLTQRLARLSVSWGRPLERSVVKRRCHFTQGTLRTRSRYPCAGASPLWTQDRGDCGLLPARAHT